MPRNTRRMSSRRVKQDDTSYKIDVSVVLLNNTSYYPNVSLDLYDSMNIIFFLFIDTI